MSVLPAVTRKDYEFGVANLYCSLYVKNLNEKINKNELKRALYMLFSTYGPVLDIVTTRVGSKGQNMRGQAHIVYRDIQTSTQAMRALQGFDLFGKEMVWPSATWNSPNYGTCVLTRAGR